MRVSLVAIFLAIPRLAAAAGSPIDSIDLSTISHVPQFYDPVGTGLMVIGQAEVYHLHDGGSWNSGAGSAGTYYATKSSVQVSGDDINYILDLPTGSPVYFREDYDNGNDASNGQLVSSDTLILHATNGSSIATLSGYALLTVDEYALASDDRFHFYNAPIGSLVPFTVTYTLSGQAWTPTTMDSIFGYNLSGTLDFTAAIVPEPSSIVLVALGFLSAVSLVRRRRSR